MAGTRPTCLALDPGEVKQCKGQAKRNLKLPQGRMLRVILFVVIQATPAVLVQAQDRWKSLCTAEEVFERKDDGNLLIIDVRSPSEHTWPYTRSH